MSDRNQVLVRERVGHVQLTEEIFTPEQQQLFRNLMGIVDRNPVVEWKRNNPNHNTDFCLIEGKLEPVKEFAMKAAYIAGVSIVADPDPKVVPMGEDVAVSVNVTVVKGERRVSMNGASSAKECGYPKNLRGVHDALARAQTRAMKIALENLLGFAFINLVIQAVFGGYEVDGYPQGGLKTAGEESAERRGGRKPNRDSMTERARDLGSQIHSRLKELKEADPPKMTEEEVQKTWDRVIYNVDNETVLSNILEDLNVSYV